MPYKNPNYCLSEKYFALKAQEAIDAQNIMKEGIFSLIESVVTDGELTYADKVLADLGITYDPVSDPTPTPDADGTFSL